MWLGVAAIAALIVTSQSIEPQRRVSTPQIQSPSTGPEHARPAVCNDGPFPFQALSAPATAERDDDDAAAALRRVLAESGPIPRFERDGWRRLSVSAGTVEFGHGDPPVLDGYVVVSAENGRWGFARSGSACIVRPYVPDGIAAPWKLDPSAPPPGAYSTSLRVIVSDGQCANARPPGERLRQPEVRVLQHAIVVTFIADYLPGPQTCPTHPPASRTVRLPERLGHRQLLDGATMPAVAPCLRLGVYDCAV